MATTYTIPSGLSLNQKKALAALLACSPCCGSGSGSGSGSSGISGCCCNWCADCTNSGSSHNFSGPTKLYVTISVPCVGTTTLEIDSNDNPPATKVCRGDTITGAIFTTGGIFYSGTSVDTVSGSCTNCVPLGDLITWFFVPVLKVDFFCTNYDSDASPSFSVAFQYYGTGGEVYGNFALSTSSCSPFLGTASGPVVCSPTIPAGNNAGTNCDGCVGQTVTIVVTA